MLLTCSRVVVFTSVADLCITVIGRDADAIRQERIAAEADADLVELRLDAMTQPDAAAALRGRTKPAIVTCRPLREGGMFDGPEEDRMRVLADAHAHGAEFIDVEWDADVTAPVDGGAAGPRRHRVAARLRLHAAQCRVDDGPPAGTGRGNRQARRHERARRRSADAARRRVRADGSSILIGMGRTAARRRACWPDGSDRAGRMRAIGVAPGQLPASRLLDEFRFRRIRPDAAVYGVLGRPVVHSLSPAMHNAGFAALGLNAVYVPIETRDLDELRAFAADVGLRGAQRHDSVQAGRDADA